MVKCQNSGVYFIEISSISKIIVSIDKEEEFWSTSNCGSEEMAREEIKLTAITDFIVLQKITGPQKNKTKYFSLHSIFHRHRLDLKRLGNYVASCKRTVKFGSEQAVLAL